jgi:hypothetical protein
MAAEAIPQSVNSDGNLRITAVAEADDAKSVADLGTGFDLTYSLKTFNRTITEAVVDDARLTLKQVLQQPGKTTESIEVQGVFGDAADVAYEQCAPGTILNVAVRYSVPNETAWTAAQVADILHVKCGARRKDAPVENGVQTYTQTWYPIQPSEEDAVIVA